MCVIRTRPGQGPRWSLGPGGSKAWRPLTSTCCKAALKGGVARGVWVRALTAALPMLERSVVWDGLRVVWEAAMGIICEGRIPGSNWGKAAAEAVKRKPTSREEMSRCMILGGDWTRMTEKFDPREIYFEDLHQYIFSGSPFSFTNFHSKTRDRSGKTTDPNTRSFDRRVPPT